ncbi:MAG: ABC transporter permease [Phycisphaeraceae bacterium]|nr:MAG: ABC transporter permease [Phycisphaeraceae bacterium]
MNPFRIFFAPLVFILRLCVQTAFLAIGQIFSRFVRSSLTMFGIIIGVAVVIGTIGGLTGMKGFVLKEFETFGARKMFMWGYVPEDMRTTVSWSDVKLTTYEANIILERAPSIEKLSPICSMRMDANYDGKLVRGVDVSGIWPDWHDIEDRQMIFGRPFSRIDIEENRQVCFVNAAAVDEMKLDTDPTGDYLQLGGRRFLIVGLVETKDLQFMGNGGDAQSEVFIPFETHKMMNPYTWTNFLLQMTDPEQAADAEASIRFILRKHRNLDPEAEDTFQIRMLQSVIEQFNVMANGITLVASIIVGFTLLVGGVGIMNIMLASVSERTREIGLRKAVGAQPLVVLLQFLIEAVVLCVVGGAIGVLIGMGIVTLLRQLVSWMSEAAVPPGWIILAFGACGFCGVVSGMFPAIKAASLNPINALRHE